MFANRAMRLQTRMYSTGAKTLKIGEYDRGKVGVVIYESHPGFCEM